MRDSIISGQASIGEGVQIGSNVSIGPTAVILGPCTIEDNVYIGAGALIGAPPEMNDHTQNAAWAGELNHAGVLIKSGAVVREGAVIHQGTYRQTTIGERTWILNRAYIAHDVCVGHDVTVSAGVSIGGHCEIGDWVNLGMNASIHQKTLISAGCMVGMGTPLARDLPPFVKAFGSPARINGVNVVGMRRLGISEREITKLQDAYLQGDLLLQKTSAQWHGLLHSAVTDWRNHEKRNPAKPNL